MGFISILMFLLALIGVIFEVLVNVIGGFNFSISTMFLILQIPVILLLLFVGILANTIKDLEDKINKSGE